MHGGTSISPVQIYKDLYELKVNKQRLNGMIRIKDSGIVGLILAKLSNAQLLFKNDNFMQNCWSIF